MKNIQPLISISTLLFLFFMVQAPLFAQPEIGASTYYGTEIESFGLNVYGHYPIGEKTKIGLDIVWWPRNAPDDARYVFTEANIDFQFTPFTVNRFSFYTSLTAGYHYAGARIKTLGKGYTHEGFWSRGRYCI